MSKIYVSGSTLRWMDGLVERTVRGAIPESMPAGFSGQPAGRIWVASDSKDEYLWYSDGGGQTRFVQGIDRGIDNTGLSSGRVYIQDGTCTDATELAWTTPSASALLIRTARAEGVLASISNNIQWFFDYNNVSGGGETNYFRMTVFPDLRDSVTVGGLELIVYNSAGCTGGVVATLTITPTNELTLTAGGNREVSASVGTGNYTGKYMKLTTGSMYIDSNNPALPLTFYCNGIDSVSVYPRAEGNDGGVCFAAPGTTTYSTCGLTCQPGRAGTGDQGICSDSSDGCTQCSAPPGSGVTGVCYNPSSPPPPPSGGCGNACTPKNAPTECLGGCPVCCNGVCSAKCPS